QVLSALETLRINFVDVLGPRGTGCEPAGFCYDFQAPNWGVVARRPRQFGRDRLSCKIGLFHCMWRQLLQFAFLLGGGRRIYAGVVSISELRLQFAVVLTRILGGASRNLGSKKIHDGAVLVGGPNRAVETQKTRPRALLATETVGTCEQSRH